MSALIDNDALICPITQCIMTDPVKAPDGHSYERAAIIEALRRNGLSPMTRQRMRVDQLVPDYTLKSIIDRFVNVTEPVSDPDTIVAYIHTNDNLTSVDLTSEDGEARPQNVVFVVDTSGSMEDEVSAATGERDGFSIMDVTKHGILTCLCGLRPEDRAAIVAFSTDARVVMPLRKMDASGKAQLRVALAGLTPDGGTNIWAGLELALKQLPNGGTIFLLTDGQPNYRPPRGEVAMLKNAMDSHDNVVVNTYGFGYNLDSKLLVQLARSTQGSYSFIPDIGTLGTVFVHAMSNLITSVDRTITLNIETEGTITMPEIIKTNHGYALPLGRITKGISRKIFIECDKPVALFPTGDVVLKCLYPNNMRPQEYQGLFKVADRQIVAMGILQCHGIARGNLDQANTFLNELIGTISDPKLQEDLNGQVREAIMPQHFNRWGRHYLPSLALAHWTQQCNNFLDKGIQQYGGRTFHTMRDKLDTAFNELPAPRPTHRERVVQQFRSSGRIVTAAPQSMRSYNSASAPCFADWCRVQLANGTLKACRDIRKGDIVSTSKGPAQIKCVLRTNCEQASFVQVGQLYVTPWHPIIHQNKWTFPNDIGQVEDLDCKCVFSFLLQPGFSDVNIEGVSCITLGHGIQKDPVASHPFYGTDKVCLCMKTLDGWQDGHVEIQGVYRDNETTLVCGLIQ